MLMMPGLGRLRQKNPWGSLASHSSLILGHQVPVRDLVSKDKVNDG